MNQPEIDDYIRDTADRCHCGKLPRGVYLDGEAKLYSLRCCLYVAQDDDMMRVVVKWNKHQRDEE